MRLVAMTVEDLLRTEDSVVHLVVSGIVAFISEVLVWSVQLSILLSTIIGATDAIHSIVVPGALRTYV